MGSTETWYALALQRAERTRTSLEGSLLAGVLFFAVALPALPQLQLYPRITLATVPPMILLGLPLAVWSGWVGAQVGGWIAGLGRDATMPVPLRGRAVWASLGLLVALGIGAVAFIATARPPV